MKRKFDITEYGWQAVLTAALDVFTLIQMYMVYANRNTMDAVDYVSQMTAFSTDIALYIASLISVMISRQTDFLDFIKTVRRFAAVAIAVSVITTIFTTNPMTAMAAAGVIGSMLGIVIVATIIIRARMDPTDGGKRPKDPPDRVKPA